MPRNIDGLIDEIDRLVDDQLAPGPVDDYNTNRYDRCPHCARDWHGIVITERVEQMRWLGRFDDSYRMADDDSRVICPGSEFIGPLPRESHSFKSTPKSFQQRRLRFWCDWDGWRTEIVIPRWTIYRLDPTPYGDLITATILLGDDPQTRIERTPPSAPFSDDVHLEIEINGIMCEVARGLGQIGHTVEWPVNTDDVRTWRGPCPRHTIDFTTSRRVGAAIMEAR